MKQALTALLLATVAISPAFAADPPKITHDWPAYYGPDGTYADLSKVPILDDLSQAELVWTSEHADLGIGKSSKGGTPSYSFPSGSADLIVYRGLVIQGYFHPKNNVVADDILLALDAATGQIKWKQVYAGEGYNLAAGKHVQYAPAPTAYDGKVFYLGTSGRLHCVEVATGKRIWDQDIEDYPARCKAAVAKVVVKPETAGGVEGVLGSVGIDRMLQSPLAVVGGVLIVSGDTVRGFDVATGKQVWKMGLEGVGTAGGMMPSPVKLNGVDYGLYTGNGKVQLFDPRSGKILWTQACEGAGIGLGNPSDLVAEGRLFIPHPTTQKKLVLSAFNLSETGLKLLWQAKEEASGGDVAYRDGVVVQGHCIAGVGGEPIMGFRTYKADDGSLLGEYNAKQELYGFSQPRLWGDRVVTFGDHCHESIWAQCWYRSISPGFKDLKASGSHLYPRALVPVSGDGKYIGVCGYAELWSRPVFVDGYLFTRGVNKETKSGVIFCWDFRALPEDARVVAAREVFAKGQQDQAVKDLIAILKGDSRRPRADACSALAKMGQAAAPAGPDLARLMSDWWQPDGKAAFAALVALGTITEKDVLAKVSDPSIDARRYAWQILATVTPKSEATIAAARTATIKEADERARQFALTCLMSHGEAAVPTLLAMIESPDEQRVGLTVLGMMGAKGKSALPKVVPLLEHADADLSRFAAVAATKIAPEDRLPDTAEKWLREIVLAPTPILGVAKCDYLLAARHLHRFGPKAMPVFTEACTVGAEKRDYYKVVRAAYGLSLYGPAAKEHLPVLEDCLKKLSGHKDYNSRIKPPLEKAMAIIKGQEQVHALEDVLKKATGF